MLQGPGQLWELSASSTGSSHFVFQRRRSLRWSSTGPSGDHFSCSWNPDPESSQGTRARLTHTPGTTRAQLASVLKAPRLSLPKDTTDLICIFTSDGSGAPKNKEERKVSNHGHKTQKRQKRTRVFPESDHLFGNLSPWKCFSTKKGDKRVFLPVFKRGVGWGMNK